MTSLSSYVVSRFFPLHARPYVSSRYCGLTAGSRKSEADQAAAGVMPKRMVDARDASRDPQR